jgi:AraC-like DNA-binding protein/quercetin dioxygenase-like cupin family protein
VDGQIIAFFGQSVYFASMPLLDENQTRQRLRKLGLERASASAFALQEKAHHLAYHWHAHSRHQMLYSLSGRVILESAQGRWLLPPQRSAWIPARTRHRTTLDRAETVSVYLRDVPSGWRVDGIRILRATPLLREMLVHAAAQWPVGSIVRKADATRRLFFAALGSLCLDWIEHELPFRLPAARDPRVGKAVDYLLKNLATADLAAAARFSGQSVRTLRRRFEPATGMSWRQYRLHAAMLRAMELLLNSSESVLEIALAVGYESPSAFSKAFLAFAGALPQDFRRSNRTRSSGARPAPRGDSVSGDRG